MSTPSKVPCLSSTSISTEVSHLISSSTPTKIPHIRSPDTPSKVLLCGDIMEEQSLKSKHFQNMQDIADDIKSAYSQYVAGAGTLLDFQPPQTKAAALLIARGDAVLKNHIEHMKNTICRLEQIMEAKDRTIAYLRQEVTNAQMVCFTEEFTEDELSASKPNPASHIETATTLLDPSDPEPAAQLEAMTSVKELPHVTESRPTSLLQ